MKFVASVRLAPSIHRGQQKGALRALFVDPMDDGRVSARAFTSPQAHMNDDNS
jgi:hypothetical protein